MVLVAVVVVLAAVVGWRVWFSTENQAERLADRIGVSIPASAERLAVDDPFLQVHESCSSMAFLMPRPNWQEYVSRYFDLDELHKRDSQPGFCGRDLIECDAGFRAEALIASEEHGGTLRIIEVIPDCTGDLAKIGWGTDN